MRVYRRVLQHCDGMLTLGGGEPTLHPRFWEYLALAIGDCDEQGVFLVTNGSRTGTALRLARLARRGIIGCALSVDDWHDPIDPRVVQAFMKEPRARRSYGYAAGDTLQHDDLREIRSVTTLVKSGRCNFGHTDDCDGGPHVMPDGTVKQCSCMDAPVIGSVFDKQLLPLDDEWACYKTTRVTA